MDLTNKSPILDKVSWINMLPHTYKDHVFNLLGIYMIGDIRCQWLQQLRGAAEEGGFKNSEKLVSVMKTLKLDGTLHGGKSKPSEPNTAPKKDTEQGQKPKKVKKPAGKKSK